MKTVIDNWYIIIAAIAVVVFVFQLVKHKQLKKVEEWLLWAVTGAERELGSGTGKLKLRQVYDMFLARFPVFALIVSFERFSELVDEALKEMKKMLDTNEAVAALVGGETSKGGE